MLKTQDLVGVMAVLLKKDPRTPVIFAGLSRDIPLNEDKKVEIFQYIDELGQKIGGDQTASFELIKLFLGDSLAQDYLNYKQPKNLAEFMTQFDLKQKLENYKPVDPKEEKDRLDALRLIENQKECFYRNCFIDGHITGSALITDSTLKKVLLIHHKALNKWFQPGGHSDGQTNTFEVALREVEEETGIVNFLQKDPNIFDIDIHIIPYNEKKNEPSHRHYDIRFLLIADTNAKVTKQELEVYDAKWISIDELLDDSNLYRIDQALRRMLLKLKNNVYEGATLRLS
jgi:8-oxo-dGTP pyrophosphatase MutT (NUDIX family)